MSYKLTIGQLQYIQTIERTDDVASRHVRMMATEILAFRSAGTSNEEWLKKAKILASEYAHHYSFVGDDTVKTAQKALFSHLELMAKPTEPNPRAAPR